MSTNTSALSHPPHPTAVVTGAGSGVGRAIALRFAREGWNTALVSRRAETLDETIALGNGGATGQMIAFPCDVSDANAVNAMGEAVLSSFPSVDVLVNSAGINVRKRSFESLSLEDGTRCWERICTAPTTASARFYPRCVRARRGRSSTSTRMSEKSRAISPGPAYVSSKFGLNGLTQQINAEERRHGIRACSICPRDINTPLLDKRPQPPTAEDRARMIQPDDIADCVWLVATLPPRAIVEEISLSSR